MNTVTVKRVTALNGLGEGDLLIIFYKMAGNIYPEYKDKNELISMICSLFEDASDKLMGQTLPADIDKIDNLKINRTV